MSSKKRDRDDHRLRVAAKIGTRARAARRALGMTQQQVADAIGVADGFYSRIERGLAVPAVGTLLAIADVLDVSVDRLLGQDDDEDAASQLRLPGLPTDLFPSQPVRPRQPAEKLPPQIAYVVERAMADPDLYRFIIALLNLRQLK